MDFIGLENDAAQVRQYAQNGKEKICRHHYLTSINPLTCADKLTGDYIITPNFYPLN
jgi:hypothetical protein